MQCNPLVELPVACRRAHSLGSRPRFSSRVLVHASAGDGRRDKRRAEEAAQRRTFAALDVALRGLQSVLSSTDLFGVAGTTHRLPAARSPEDASTAAALGKHAGKSKWVSFHTKCRSTRDVAQCLTSSKRLDQYLCLPAEEYSLLDPAWVQRTDSHTFRFSVPLGAVLSELLQGAPAPGGLADLVPAITVTTALDEDGNTVTLSGRDASLGSSQLDEQFSLGFETRLRWKGGPPPGWTPPQPVFVATAVTESEQAALTSSSGDGGDAAALECTMEQVPPPPGWELRCQVDLTGQVLLPQPLASLPRPLLGGAASLFATAMVQVLLPRFADMLAADYARWAAGNDRRAPAGRFIVDERARL
jgi:hypothetical protein